MFGEKAKKIVELEDKLSQAEEIIKEIRAALKVPEGEEVTHYCWGLQMTLETNANLLEGAANVIKAADEWFVNQKKAKTPKKKKV